MTQELLINLYIIQLFAIMYLIILFKTSKNTSQLQNEVNYFKSLVKVRDKSIEYNIYELKEANRKHNKLIKEMEDENEALISANMKLKKELDLIVKKQNSYDRVKNATA